LKPAQLIHLTSAPGELVHKDIAVQVIPQSQATLWPILSYQEQYFSIERSCPYCHGEYMNTPHNPAARVDCLHMVGEHSWFTTDICCRACLDKYGLTTSIEYYLSHCGDITMIRRDVLTGAYGLMH
jgi:hypothetical protein